MRRPQIVLALLVATGCGASQHTPTAANTPATPTARRSQEFVLVTVESARIAERAAGTDGWDTADSGDEGARTVKALASMMSLVVPEGGAVLDTLANFVPKAEPEADATYPDPYVRVTFNEPVGTRSATSAVLANTIRPSWGYSFYVRLDTLRDSGIDIAVADDDSADDDPNIGQIHFPRAELATVAATGQTSDIERSDGELEQIAVRIEPVTVGDASTVRRFPLDLSLGVATTDIRVAQGSLVSVRTTGSGTVGTFSCTDLVTPGGISNGECRNYNLSGWPAIETAPHASAVALLGAGAKPPFTQAVSLVSGTQPSQCVRFLAPASGPIGFAINDRDFSNNHGAYTFELKIEPPPEGTNPTVRGSTTTSCDGEGL